MDLCPHCQEPASGVALDRMVFAALIVGTAGALLGAALLIWGAYAALRDQR